MPLDVLSEKGREATSKARWVIKCYQGLYPDFSVIETPNASPADVDFLICKNEELVAIMEMKVRSSAWLTWKKVEQGAPFMIDHNKLLKGKKLSKSLCVPLYFWMFHEKSGNLLSWLMTDAAGNDLKRYTNLTRKGNGKKISSVTSINDNTIQNDKVIGLQLRNARIIAKGISIA